MPVSVVFRPKGGGAIRGRPPSHHLVSRENGEHTPGASLRLCSPWTACGPRLETIKAPADTSPAGAFPLGLLPEQWDLGTLRQRGRDLADRFLAAGADREQHQRLEHFAEIAAGRHERALVTVKR